MKKLFKHKVLFLGFSIILTVNSVAAADKLIPKAKPKPDEEIVSQVKQKKHIYPKKKPAEKIEKISNEVIEITDNNKDSVAIYPQKKPIVFKKSIDKTVSKSLILSKNDFKIAKEVFKAIDKKKWQTAIKLSKKSKDKSLFKLVYWIYLKKPTNSASFYDYLTFINNNPYYPRINRLRYLAEHKINLNKTSPSVIKKWFGDLGPLSDFGKIKLGEIYLLDGNIEKGSQLIKEGWIKARLSKADLKYLRKKYKKIITVSDNIARADWHAWEGKHWDVQRMLRYLPKDETALYRARQLLMSRSYGVDNAIAKIPISLKNDIGLKYDRLKWRRRRGRLEGSLEILFKTPNDKNKLVRPDKWWKERSILTRSLIYKKKYALAYKVSSNHFLDEGPEYAEAEWLSGWIALTFLNDPNMALQHFKNFYDNVGYPISLSRGSYWIARTYKKINNKQKSDEWFKESSKYLNTYYGQLAFNEINKEKPFTLQEEPEISKDYQKTFNKNLLVKSVRLLNELDKTKYSKDILKHLAQLNVDEGSEILAGKLAIEIGRYDYAIQIAKKASYEKRFFNKINYPIIETPGIVNKKRMPKPELVLSVIRQESEFDSKANSSAGAQGMMQLMTYTAKLVAKQAKLPYSKSKLKSDPSYNIKLGSYYLSSLLEIYEGSYPFALAAYNAGPKRVKYWKKINGDPQKGKISYVDWIELIKFKETRNYVQRVLENINVYRYMLSGKPIIIYDFFEDKPHY
ncbi:MAG: lytic transglycosylase domain-containing protein [Candidatus Pelagibacterales bacterium]|nr:MAG: lytic transglycosylase domain-containing protein [Pelagibacterales bacterium]